jgi:hypothetical protein
MYMYVFHEGTNLFFVSVPDVSELRVLKVIEGKKKERKERRTDGRLLQEGRLLKRRRNLVPGRKEGRKEG